MIIRRLLLENIRSHRKSSLDFGEGFNCIQGGVGTGKTSVLYAIHFALFGEPLYKSYDYLIREGSSCAKVQLEFEHQRKAFKITRMLRRERNKVAQDMTELELCQDDKRIAWGKASAVQEQLKHQTGLEKKVFEEFIWIQQEKLKTILHIPSSERQQLLDEVFGLSDFRKARDKSLQYQKSYSSIAEIFENDSDVANLEELKIDVRKLRNEHEDKVVKIELMKNDFEEATEKLGEAQKELEILEEQEKKSNELEKEQSYLNARKTELQSYLDALLKRSTELQKTKNKLNETIDTLKTEESKLYSFLQEREIGPISSIEEIERKVTELEKYIEKLTTEITELKAKQREIINRKKTLEEEKICPICRRPLDTIFKHDVTQEISQEQAEIAQKTDGLAQELAKSRNNRATLTEARVRFENLDTKMVQTSESLRRLEMDEKELASEIHEKTKLISTVVEPRLEEIMREFSNFNLGALHSARYTWEQAVQEHERLKASLESVQGILAGIEQRLDDAEGRLKTALKKLEKGKKARRISELIADIRALYQDVVPSLRATYIEGLAQSLQSIIDDLTNESGRFTNIAIDEEYTPSFSEGPEHAREINQLSGGERTWLALSYRTALGQLVTEAQIGQSIEFLILDEPTESLGSEDRSIDALASTLSNLKSVRQIIAVTHSEDLAGKATSKTMISKHDGVSVITTP